MEGEQQQQNRGGNYHHNNRGHHHNRGDRNQNREHGDKKRTWTPRPGEERPKKDAILDLSKYKDQQIRVKFQGGREVVGVLKGWDQLMNLVLDDVQETLRDPDDENVLLDKTRELGQVVVRGPLLLSIAPAEGTQVIENPFAQQE